MVLTLVAARLPYVCGSRLRLDDVDPDGRLLAIGEVKWGDVMGMGHLARLQAIGAVLGRRGQSPGVLALFSGGRFSPDLEAAARSTAGRIQLVDLVRLYSGS